MQNGLRPHHGGGRRQLPLLRSPDFVHRRQQHFPDLRNRQSNPDYRSVSTSHSRSHHTDRRMTSAASLEATMTLPSPKSRAELLTLLAEACELEHGLACSYLYAAFSLKQDASEGGLTPEQVMLTRQWAGQIFFVAAQEMLHLAQAWNLLVAAGGAPYYLRP